MHQDLPHRPVRHRARPVPPPPSVITNLSSDAVIAREDPLVDAGSVTLPPARSAPEDVAPETSFEVGYGKPPVASRFKPGQSGNPRGRPKGARGVNATIRETLEAKIVIRSGGKAKSVSRFEAMLMKVMEKALQGDVRAAEKLLILYRQAAPEEEAVVSDTVNEAATSETDLAILARFRESILAEGAEP